MLGHFNITDCHEGMLGTLDTKHLFSASPDQTPLSHKEHIINELPDTVKQQLREKGLPLESYSAGELKAADIAAAVDGQVFDDPDGVTFNDKLSFTEQEKARRAEKQKPESPYTLAA